MSAAAAELRQCLSEQRFYYLLFETFSPIITSERCASLTCKLCQSPSTVAFAFRVLLSLKMSLSWADTHDIVRELAAVYSRAEDTDTVLALKELAAECDALFGSREVSMATELKGRSGTDFEARACV